MSGDAAAVRRFAVLAGTAASLALLSVAPRPAAGQEWLEMTTARQTAGEEALEMEVLYGAGRLRIGPAPEDLLYRARMRYEASSFRPLRSFERTDGGARVRVGVHGGEDLGDLDWDLSDLDPSRLRELGRSGRSRDGPGEMDVGLPRGVPTDLRVRVGAAQSTMELGGLPLRRVRLATGASQTVVSFDRPNPVVMDELRVEAGAASLEIRGLGDARARRVAVENAVGEVTLDLSGRWTSDATASVKTGVGKVTLRVPRELGVKLDRQTFLSSISGLRLEKADDGSYRTGNWEEAEHRLDLQVQAAFGSIEVDRLP